MSEKTLVRINLDPLQEIARLDGIDTELAGRIVACRLAGFLFIGPEDLTQVEGIDLEMAFRMAREIDWEAPRPARPKVRPARKQKHVKLHWGAAAFHGVAATPALLWLLIARVLPMLALAVMIGWSGSGWLLAGIMSALVLAVMFMLLGSLTSAMLALSRQPNRLRRGKRARTMFSMLAVISLLLALTMSAILNL